MRDLNLKSIHVGTTGISAHARKVEAIEAARAAGWPASAVARAANRFSRFWIICQGIGSDTLRILCADGSCLDIPRPGVW
jgi:hypothetical protein